jgi:NTP pyrophosphatase (non-canonical NTP hydrolase)
MKRLTFDDLRFANVQRQKEWDPENRTSDLFMAVEFAGEAGEVCNKIKKLERQRLGMPGSRTTFFELAMEIADAQITLDLLAMRHSIDMEEAVRLAFNAKSEEFGFITRIE